MLRSKSSFAFSFTSAPALRGGADFSTAPALRGGAACWLLATLISVPLLAPQARAGTRTINFDDFTAPASFADAAPLTNRYASLGVTFAGPAPGSGGAVLDVTAFPVTGESSPNALAFDGSQTYSGGGTASGPETITFATPIHSASIHVGQSSGGTVRMTGFDG